MDRRDGTGITNNLVIKGNKKEVRAITNLSQFGMITFSREESFKTSSYTIHFFKPTVELRNLYNLGNEVLIISCADGMRDFRSRTKDFIDYILITREEFKNRLDRITCFLVDNNPDIVRIVDEDKSSNPDSRLIIPFSLEELQETVSDAFFNNRLRDFLYIRDLFGISSPLNNEYLFFGKDRTYLITDLYSKYKQGEPGGVFGLRRIGKTSVLLLLKNRINNERGAAVYFDCSTYANSRWNSFLRQIIQRIIETYSFNTSHQDDLSLPRDFNIDLSNTDRYSEENAAISFEEDIKKIYTGLNNTRIHLIFDEIEHIGYQTSSSENWRKGYDALYFWSTLRSITQMNNAYFSYLIAGVNPMCVELSKIGEIDNPIFGNFTPIYMKLFDYEDVKYMVSSIGGHIGLSFENQVFDKLVDDYGGHPFLTRQVCSRINKTYLDKKTPRPVTVTKYDYELHSEDFRLDMTNVIEQILGVLESYYPKEYDLLKKLALNGRDSFKKENLEGEKSVQHLLGYCLVDKFEGEYFIRIDSISKYLQEKFIYDKEFTEQIDKRSVINRRRDSIETRLRQLIWTIIQSQYGRKTNDRIIECMEKSNAGKDQIRKLNAAKGKEIMDELFLDQLRVLIINHWKYFEALFIDRSRFDIRFEILNKSRSVASHSKSLSEEDEVDYNHALRYFEEILQDL